mmetsp:Transcript_18346/g.52508  ORF Transcript_18346/g.52508 Transcript_18346/m.52508 type:complete len:329 (-) Transcript_18346:173-1159(-)
MLLFLQSLEEGIDNVSGVGLQALGQLGNVANDLRLPGGLAHLFVISVHLVLEGREEEVVGRILLQQDVAVLEKELTATIQVADLHKLLAKVGILFRKIVVIHHGDLLPIRSGRRSLGCCGSCLLGRCRHWPRRRRRCRSSILLLRNLHLLRTLTLHAEIVHLGCRGILLGGVFGSIRLIAATFCFSCLRRLVIPVVVVVVIDGVSGLSIELGIDLLIDDGPLLDDVADVVNVPLLVLLVVIKLVLPSLVGLVELIKLGLQSLVILQVVIVRVGIGAIPAATALGLIGQDALDLGDAAIRILHLLRDPLLVALLPFLPLNSAPVLETEP